MVVPPDDDHLHHVIDTMALYVLDGGCAFEQAIMERGRGNPLFNFLFELGSKEHTYYVWRLYSFAQVCPNIPGSHALTCLWTLEFANKFQSVSQWQCFQLNGKMS